MRAAIYHDTFLAHQGVKDEQKSIDRS
ncbi:MAG: hypothetical protein AB1502_11710 [Thermodesulfobacteriota bacterium]